jgi:RNA polymerase sigma factor (sigma-70 family)
MRVEGWNGVGDLSGFLRRVVGPRCRDENEVDDVVQETCLRAARYRRGLADEQMLRPWAARIALNVLAARARRRREAEERTIGEAHRLLAPEPEEDAALFLRVGPWLIERGVAVRALGRSVAELHAGDRRLLGAFYGAGESCRHAARVCETTPLLAKVRLYRARQRLARLLRRRIALEARFWIAPDGSEHEVGGAPPAVASGPATLGLRRASSVRRPGVAGIGVVGRAAS